MAMNRIQFQRGLSLPDFMASFGSEAQCEQALIAARWPDGWRCPRCAHAEHYRLARGGHGRMQCLSCRHQSSPTAGTMLADTKLSLRIWFLAMYLIGQAKNGMSSLELKRQLGVSYPTAWLMHHKILSAMAQQDAGHRLAGEVQLDDAYLGGEHPGKPGRGSPNKTPFVAAVSLEQGRPRYIKLTAVAGFTSEAIAQWAKTHLAPGTLVRSDGLGCFAAVQAAGCVHQPIVVGQRLPRDLPEFTWINTVLGNLKTALCGTHHALKFAKYAQSYLAGFAYRFNRRFDLRGLAAALIVDVLRTHPRPRRIIRGNADIGC
jgi:transposase-like protein